jgi:hypothetical protein
MNIVHPFKWKEILHMQKHGRTLLCEKKQVTKGHMLYDSTYIKHLECSDSQR